MPNRSKNGGSWMYVEAGFHLYTVPAVVGISFQRGFASTKSE